MAPGRVVPVSRRLVLVLTVDEANNGDPPGSESLDPYDAAVAVLAGSGATVETLCIQRAAWEGDMVSLALDAHDEEQ